jgi:hypothetical protein
MEIKHTPRTGVLAGFTGSAADLNAASGVAVNATFAVAAEASHAIVTTVTLKDSAGVAVGEAMGVRTWLSDAAAGVESVTAPTSATAIGTGVVLKAVTANLQYEVVASAAGVYTVTTTQTAAKTYYLNVLLPNGKIKSVAVPHLG